MGKLAEFEGCRSGSTRVEINDYCENLLGKIQQLGLGGRGIASSNICSLSRLNEFTDHEISRRSLHGKVTDHEW